MIHRDEINQIRAELERVQRSVTNLSQRLDEIEARDKAPVEVPAPPIVVTVPGPPIPPPLPASAFAPREATIAAVAPVRIGATETSAPKVTPQPPAIPKRAAVAAVKAPRRFGPPEDMGWEMALTTWWIPRMGVLLLALGTVWGLTFISNQYRDALWMPYARVALGYALALGLGGIGWKLEKKYPGYARVLMGGGFGLLYFVTFATWYIPPTRIAPSQEFTLLLLALLVAAWGAVAQWRKSQLIALSMTLLGHFTVALSTLSLETPSRTAVGGLLVLGVGSAWFLVKNGWYAVALSAMIGSYLNQFFWLAQAPPSGAPLDFFLGMTVLATYLVLYALADRVTPFEHASTRTRTRNIYCGMNTGGFLLLGLALMQGFDFTRDREYVLYFVTALFAGGMGWSYVLRQDTTPDHKPDTLSNIYYTKASMLATAGIAAWLDGPTVTLSIALQSLALLAGARRSRRPAGRLLSLGTSFVAFIHGWYTLGEGGLPQWGSPDFTGYILVILLTASVFWAVSELYRVTPWHTFAQGPWKGPEFLRDVCESLEILEQKAGTPIVASRMLLSHMLVGFGAFFLAANFHHLLPLHQAAPALSILGLAAAGLGLARRAAPPLAGCAFFLALGLIWHLAQLLGGNPVETHATLIGWVVAASLIAVSELLRIFLAERFSEFRLDSGIQGAWFRNHALVALVVAMGAVLSIAASLQERAEPANAVATAGAVALAATGYAAATGAANVGFLGMALTLFTVFLSPNVPQLPAPALLALLGALMAAFAATATEDRWWGHARPGLAFQRLLPLPYLLYGATAWNTIWVIDTLSPLYALPSLLAVAATAFGLAVLVLHARAMASLAAILLGVALFAWRVNSGATGTPAWHVGGLALITVGLVGDRFLTLHNPFPKPWPARTLFGLAWLACLGWNDRMLLDGWQYTGLALIAAGCLTWTALFRTRTAGALALLSGVFGTIPLIVDPVPGMTLPATWAAYGSLIAFWLATERGVAIALQRTKAELMPGHATTFTILLAGTPTFLGVLCLARIDAIQNFYLTMAWTAWGLAIFCWALLTRQPWFRYMGLAVFALTLSRVFLLDVWRLEGLYRVGAVLFLGVALLSVAYGYTRWRASQSVTPTENEAEQQNS